MYIKYIIYIHRFYIYKCFIHVTYILQILNFTYVTYINYDWLLLISNANVVQSELRFILQPFIIKQQMFSVYRIP